MSCQKLLFVALLLSPPVVSFCIPYVIFLLFSRYLGAAVGADTEKLKQTIDQQAKTIKEKNKEIAECHKRIQQLQDDQ